MSEPAGPTDTSAATDAKGAVAETDVADPVDAAWSALLREWESDERHKAFVGLAASLERLPDAAAHYRSVDGDADRRERAERGKQAIVAHAIAKIDALPRSSSVDARSRRRWMIPVAILVALFTANFVLAAATHNRMFVSVPAFALEVLLVALLPWRSILR